MTSGPRLALALILVCGPGLTAIADDPAVPEALKPPSFEEFVVIPLRVHVLSSTDLPDVNCGLTDADIQRVLGKVNGIWHQAGVHWGLEALVREPAAKQDQFKTALEADEGDKLNVFRMLAPAGSRSDEGIDVYYIHKFSVNGVYLGARMAFVQETAKLRPVPGGIDEPLPRVTAHELGHALGLPHRQDRTNLLASGNNGTTLNEAEVTRARKRAETTPGSLTVPELRKKVDEALAKDENAKARRLLAWLADVPGEGADEARKKLETLPAEKKEEAKPDDLPPGHRPIKPVPSPAVTPEMTVSVSFLSGDDVLFTGKTKDFKLSIRPKPGRKKAGEDFPVFKAENLAKLPAGEFSFSDVPLSAPGSLYQVTIEFDELHFPGLFSREVKPFNELIDQESAGVGGPNLIVKIDGGASVRINGIASKTVTGTKVVLKGGQTWSEVFFSARTASRAD